MFCIFTYPVGGLRRGNGLWCVLISISANGLFVASPKGEAISECAQG